MNQKIRRLAGLAIAFLALVACAKDNSNEPITAPSSASGGRIVLSADLSDAFSINVKDSETLKTLSIFQKDSNGDGHTQDKEPFTFSIDIAKYGAKKMHLFLKKSGQSEVVSLYTPVTITQNPNTKRYRMSAVVDNVPTQSGVDLTQGQWYISGFWGGGDEKEGASEDRLKHKVKEVMPVSPAKIGDSVSMDIPLGFPWTKISGKHTGSNYTLQHLNLAIQPMGVLLSLLLENRTKYPVDIVALDKQMHGFAFGGYFDISNNETLTEGKFPPFKPTSYENEKNEVVNILPKKIQLKSAEKTTMPIYMWIMPTEDKASERHSLTFTLVSDKRTTNDTKLYINDRFDKNGVGIFTDHYVIDLSFKRTPKNSTFYFKEVKIRSGLMITEYFINRHRIDLSGDGGHWFQVREPNFLGYVELYNPNIDPLDLEHYALARISNLRWTENNYGRVTVHPNYGFFHPFAKKRSDEWKAAGTIRPQGTADRHADEYTQSHKALLLSLKLKNGEKSSFQPNSLGFSSPLETKADTKAKLEWDPDNDNRTEHVRFLKPQGGFSEKARLEGGKTMLLLGNGFLKAGDPSNIPSYDYYYYNRKYNFYPQHKISVADWKKIMDDPMCQIIVAVDNYKDRNAYPIYPKSGVLNLNWSDALILVQKHPQDSTRRRIVDATSTHPFSRKNNWTDFVSKVTLAKEDELGYAHFRVRTVAQRMPEFLNFSEDQWLPIKFGESNYGGGKTYPTSIPIPDKASPGRRSTDPDYNYK